MNALASQMPFALALALNDGAAVAMKTALPQTWAEHITVRNPNFLKAALSTTGTRASKTNLRVVIYDRFGRGNLKLHDTGGSARAKTGSLAIPVSEVSSRRGAKGIPKGLQPRNLPNSFVTDGRRPNAHLKQNAVYQREGAYRGKGTVKSGRGKRRKEAADFRTVRLKYVLKTSNPVRPDVPLTQEFQRVMRREVKKAFGIRMRQAMATARRTR